MDGHHPAMSHAGPHGKPDQAEMLARIAGSEQQEHAQRGVDAPNHVEVRWLFWGPRPPARPEPVQDRDAKDEHEAEGDKSRTEQRRGRLRAHGILPRRTASYSAAC